MMNILLPLEAKQAARLQGHQVKAGQTLNIRFGAVNQARLNQQVAQASKVFTGKALEQMAETAVKGNMLFSPESLWFLANLLHAGEADGNSQLASVLQLSALNRQGVTKDQIMTANQTLAQNLVDLARTTGVDYKSGNSVWTRAGELVKPEFISLIQLINAKIGYFKDGDPTDINQWASDETETKIPTLYEANELSNAVAVLANAAYLKAPWTHKFPPENTKISAFKGLKGTTQVSMMAQEGMFRVSDVNGVKVVTLPYGPHSDKSKTNHLSMSLFVPEKSSFNAFTYRKLLGAQHVQDTMERVSKAVPKKIKLTMPKFELAHETDLFAVLKKMGVNSQSLPMGFLVAGGSVSQMKQKAAITVNEEGSEVAVISAAQVTRSITPHMDVDRPFFYAIHDKEGRIVFVGSVTDLPNESGASSPANPNAGPLRRSGLR